MKKTLDALAFRDAAFSPIVQVSRRPLFPLQGERHAFALFFKLHATRLRKLHIDAPGRQTG